MVRLTAISFVQNDHRRDNQTVLPCATTGNGSRINFCKFKSQDGAKSVIIAGFVFFKFVKIMIFCKNIKIFGGVD